MSKLLHTLIWTIIKDIKAVIALLDAFHAKHILEKELKKDSIDFN